MIDTIKIVERLHEIEIRVEEIKAEAPILARSLDEAMAYGNQAEVLICQLTMSSRLNEMNELLKEVNTIECSVKKSLKSLRLN